MSALAVPRRDADAPRPRERDAVRVLVVTPEAPAAPRGGLGVVVGDLAATLPSYGLEVSTLTLGGAAEGQGERDAAAWLDPYAPPPAPARGGVLERAAARAVATAETSGAEVVHAHDWLAIDAGRLVRERLGLPLLAHVHSTEWDRGLGRVDPDLCEREGTGLRAADVVLCVSARTRATVVSRYALAPERVHVVHPGVTTPVRGPRGAATRPGTVTFLGRLVPQKGVELFLRTAALVRAALPDTRFVLAGDGPGFGAALERALELGLGDALRLTGHLGRDDVARLLARSSCVVVPSLAEPFGLVGPEAAAAGVPVVASRACGFLEALPAFEAFDPLDADAAAAGVRAALTAPERVARWRASVAPALAALAPARATHAVARHLAALAADRSPRRSAR